MNYSKSLNNISKQNREEAKRRILEEYPDISESTRICAFNTSRTKIPKVSELETVYATREQQEEMERLLRKNKKK